MTAPSALLPRLTEAFAEIPEVEALLLAGSRAAATGDALSDYDLYVYGERPVPLEARRALFRRFDARMELDNRYWETEDDGVVEGVALEVIYRPWAFIEEQLERTLARCEGWVGYSTCFWHNYLTSQVLFDRTGRAARLQERCQVPYPAALKASILEKNLPLLGGSVTDYPGQVAKAIERRDWVSLNHRVAAFLASYFDVLFALNDLPHPGEKKLVRLAQERCPKLPPHFAQDVEALTAPGYRAEEIPRRLERMARELRALA